MSKVIKKNIDSAHAWLVKLIGEEVYSENQENLNTLLSTDTKKAWQKVATLMNVTEKVLCEKIASNLGYPVASNDDIDTVAISLVPERIARRYLVCPLKYSGHTLTIATATPLDRDMISVLGFTSGHNINISVATPNDIEEWITMGYGKLSRDAASKSANTHPDSEYGEMDKLDIKNDQISDSVIVQIVNKMITEAAELNASDIHIEPFVEGGIVRYRVDGLLRRISTLPGAVYAKMMQRIKAMFRLDIATKLIAQDGSSSLKCGDDRIEMRLSVLPVSGGEKAVIRLIKESAAQSLENLGIAEQELIKLKDIISYQSGVFLVTGPTGSGKTSTLYAALKELNSYERCLVTIEDPVEYHIDGIAQVNVNQSQGLTFASSLRALLRQDPDVILVGEIRDEETAEIALKAALTGHFVLSTLHTRDAITTVPRLLDLGISESILADALAGLSAQRLARGLCQDCASDEPVNSSELEIRYKNIYQSSRPRHPIGCEHCNYTGYQDRLPLLELVSIDSDFSDAVRRNEPKEKLKEIAIASGMRIFSVLGREAIDNGKSSVDEIYRVLGQDIFK
ncbi:MAG: type II secretory ATPase GspE/PulE/Tfp pilus assembly ATPase PilB-like protein [Gammaproteobacteria bacterium]|jgi:type II secretory ATPase GspE/PulE/Tfp pilus assembly ATPase PilB-like protein